MRINELPAATEVAQNDVLAIDTQNGTYRVPRSVLAPSPYVATIPTGQWSGSGNDYYITVNASNVSVNSILVPCYDADSRSRLNGPVWCVPAAGSFTIHTSAIPSGTVTILVQFPGVMGEAQYQVLADVYSKSQAVAKADIVNNLTSTSTTAPLSANMGKMLEEHIQQSTANFGQWSAISSFPFTAPENGFVYLYLNPSSAAGGYARYTYTNNGLNMQVTITAPDGNGVAVYAPINKYASLSQAALSGGSVTGRFMQA